MRGGQNETRGLGAIIRQTVITEEQLIEYLSGRMSGPERERFEARLAEDPDALRQLVEQEKMDVALSMLLAKPGRTRVKQSIMTLIEGPAEVEVKSKIYERVEFETRRRGSATHDSSCGSIWDWVKSLPIQIQLAGLAVMAIAFFYLGRPNERQQIAKGDPTGNTNEFRPPIKLPAKQPRDPVEWPFASSSPWNTPIGSEAKFTEPVGIDLAAGIRIYDAHQVHPTVRASSASTIAPLQLYRANDPNPVASLRIAPSDIPTNTRNFALVADDGKTLYDITGGQLNGADITANQVVVADLTGSGMPDEYDAPTATGFSDYAGSLCAADFNGPIRRALGAVFHPSVLAANSDGSAHSWPASKTPSDYQARFGAFRQAGNLRIGTLLAIPPSVNVAEIGVGSSGPAYELAKAFQNYGLYLKKPLAGSGNGPMLGMCGDMRGAILPPDFDQQLAIVAGHLKVVANNGPESVGGGGTPIRPLAPEFNP